MLTWHPPPRCPVSADTQILELDADNKEAKRELAALKRKQREKDAADAQVFGKVFGKLAKQGLYRDVKVVPGKARTFWPHFSLPPTSARAWPVSLRRELEHPGVFREACADGAVCSASGAEVRRGR